MTPAPELRLPRPAGGVHRTRPPGHAANPPGVRAAITDPCGDAETFEDWLACQSSKDPFVLY
ncbi:hypothetical protein [Amycolatopsis sp. cmx-4-61]|uniref:hypothetical protein n=1 Tax=Amycolatopsis sp. cmx-4-61 TaxID=2790937 RepID=UPI00397CFCAE